jgi:putative transcriptional regulator
MRMLQALRARAGSAVAASLAMAFVLGVGSCTTSENEPQPIAQASATTTKSLTGWLLVATPKMSDPRFARTVIYIVRHDEDGAMGFVVNRVLGREAVLKILSKAEPGDLEAAKTPVVPIHYGGPVQPTRGFVLHTADYATEATIAVTPNVSLTANREILTAIAHGRGPKRSLIAVGYAGWGPGQLEAEIERRDWVVVPADNDIVFDRDFRTKWRRAFDLRGIDL